MLGRVFPGIAVTLDRMSLYQVSIPIAICLFFMMYPIMVKIDFSQAKRAAQTPKPVVLTLVVNWLIKPFTMVVFAQFFSGVVVSTAVGGYGDNSRGRDRPGGFLHRRLHFVGHCPLYGHGDDVGLLVLQ